MDGNIIDIKRFSLHDGEGIRTTVFLKGCGLRCAWCHNPEGMDGGISLWYLGSQCIRCRACLGVCPSGALSSPDGEEPFIRIDQGRCVKCGRCVEACPTTALSFDGRRLSSAAVAEIVLRDRDFYRQSGGGVTISGGDPLVQHRFALEILATCRAAGVRTVIETCMQGPWEVLEAFLPVTDSFLVDLKLSDPIMHERFTGRGNTLIRENYRRLAAAAKDLLTRIPLIPGVTATEDNIRALARFVAESNPGGRVELINFNPLAADKYRLMDRDRSFFRGMKPLGSEALDGLYGILAEEGLKPVREHRSRAARA